MRNSPTVIYYWTKQTELWNTDQGILISRAPASAEKKITEATFLPPGLLVLFVLPIWILIDIQRWIQPLYIHITAYCQSVMLPYTTGLKGSDMYLFRNVNGLLKKTSINTSPGKCQDDVRALRFSKTMYHVRLRVGQHSLYSCQNFLFRSVDYFDILFRGVNELNILFDGVNELSIIFDAVNKLIHGVSELHITFPGVNELDILFLTSMSKIFYFQASMS